MTGRKTLLLGASVLAASVLGVLSCAAAEPQRRHLVRLAELDIDPAQLDAYKVALREEIETSIKVEPGVLTLYAVSIEGHPEQIRLFEVYADELAYQSHLHSRHFLAYKDRTQKMVKVSTALENRAYSSWLEVILGVGPNGKRQLRCLMIAEGRDDGS